jgi:hypothetical protein
MTDEFLRCYRAVNMEDNTERYKKRWDGVCSFVENASTNDVEALIRIVFHIGLPVEEQKLLRIKQAFKDTDELFEMSGNEREIEVLSEAMLNALHYKTSKAGNYATLGVITAGAHGGRVPDFQIDLIGSAIASLNEKAVKKRDRPNLVNSIPLVEKINFEAVANKCNEQFNAEGVSTAFNLAGQVVQTSFTQLQNQVKKQINEANRFIDIQDEELQMLWWLIGEQSWEFDSFFKKLNAKAKPLIIAKELADMTNFIPGPIGIKSLLARAGLSDHTKLTIPVIINECDQTWLGSLVHNLTPSPVTLPIHFAIIRKLETGENEKWITGWEAAAKIASTHKISALNIGQLFYLERILIALNKE